MKLFYTILLVALTTFQICAQEQEPIIDMHFHGAFVFNEESVQPIKPWLKALDSYNVHHAVLAAYPHHLSKWTPQSPERLIPSLMFPCIQQFVEKCFNQENQLFPDIEWVRQEIEASRIKMFGEVLTELYGISPNDPRLEPYFSLAEEFDIPFALHMGPGPVWAVVDQSVYSDFPDFKIKYSNPLKLEEVLRRHPDLRIYIMHAGWPMVDELLALLWHNPNVYAELGHLQIAVPRTEYYRYLKRIVDAGFGDRIMYGSDVGLNSFGKGIEAIREAEFLTKDQKRDILYNNAARFLRINEN